MGDWRRYSQAVEGKQSQGLALSGFSKFHCDRKKKDIFVERTEMKTVNMFAGWGEQSGIRTQWMVASLCCTGGVRGNGHDPASRS
jgi:hypothetical protein